jgi:predicted RNase H-like HicB family nuclease
MGLRCVAQYGHSRRDQGTPKTARACHNIDKWSFLMPTIVYAEEPGYGWSASSPDLPGWRVFGDTRADTERLAAEGARFVRECETEEANAS